MVKRDEVLSNLPSLGLVGAENSWDAVSFDNTGEFPSQIVRYFPSISIGVKNRRLALSGLMKLTILHTDIHSLSSLR